MFPFLARLILFVIAISVLRSVIAFVQRALNGGRAQAAARTAAGPAAGTTMLQQDPVCGTYVAIDSSLKRVVGGKVVHFCSPECRDKFQA